MERDIIRIGTRGSQLALKQAHELRNRLILQERLGADRIEIVVIRTSGDRIQDRPLSEVGGKGLFTKEIEEALAAGRIDMAVHSMKDVETRLPDGLVIPCLLAREDPRDAFISLKARTLAGLPKGAVVGSSSLRRQAQLRRLRPDVEVVTFRGNVDTRLRKLADGMADATLLALAGLKRLEMEDKATEVLEPDIILPAIAQGAIGIEIRDSDAWARDLLAPLNDRATEICVMTERAFLAALDGSCRTPIAGLATLDGEQVSFRGQILTVDGREAHEAVARGMTSDAAVLGTAAAADVLGRAGRRFFDGTA